MRGLIGESASLKQLKARLARVAPTPLPVLISGETGTGKELVARAVHDQSAARGAFIPVDCAALAQTLVEAELFGHERGAFTGANNAREGLVAAAHEGTFFLDEVGELPLDAQTRLLRLLESGTYRPVGAQEERHAQLRVVAASWRDLSQLVEEGRFRRDLYHRLAVVELHLPSLRERPDDILPLLQHFLDEAAQRAGHKVPVLDASVRSYLQSWPWPGNVRELRNVASYLAALSPGARVGMAELPPQLLRPPPQILGRPAPRILAGASLAIRLDLPYMEARRVALDDFQQRYIEAQLEAHDGNVSATARAAGMDRRSIQRILTRATPPSTHEDP